MTRLQTPWPNISRQAAAFIVIVLTAIVWIYGGTQDTRAARNHSSNQHCAELLEPVPEGSEQPSKAVHLGCYSTQEEAENASLANASTSAPHCIMHLESVPVDSKDQSRIISSSCYSTFADAISAATGGIVELDPNVLPEHLTQEMLEEQGMGSDGMSSVVIGIDYDDVGRSSLFGTWTYYGGAPCTASSGYIRDVMPDGWNDRVSSARSYSSCYRFYHFEHTLRQGTSITCDMGQMCDTMGYMHDRTSSLRWSYNN